MNMMELIKTRKSVRTFDGRMLSAEDREKLCSYIAAIRNPYEIPVEFILLDAKENGLFSPVIEGEQIYIAAKVPKVAHCEEAFGYSFEKMVLYAWSLGIGTTWIGGTMKRELFEKAAGTGEHEIMMIVSPLGYPAKEKSEVEVKLRKAVHADERLAVSELFFDEDFSKPLNGEDSDNLLEAVRWAPSAVNIQPWRVVRRGNAFHFYKKRAQNYIRKVAWDVQKIDMGIALCHFMSVAGGTFAITDPGITTDEDMEYIATVTV